MKVWIAKHTGLPSFYSPTPARVVAPDGRVLADGTLPVMVSDTLAIPGIESIYKVDGQEVRLTRTGGTSGTQVVTDMRGRGVPGLYAQPAGTVDWQSDVRISKHGRAVYQARQKPRESEIRVLTYEEDQAKALWELLRASEHIIVGTGSPVAGLDRLRPVVVKAAKSDLFPDGITKFTIRYVEFSPSVSAGAPIVTWGEWAAYDGGVWSARTVEALLQMIAGMP